MKRDRPNGSCRYSRLGATMAVTAPLQLLGLTRGPAGIQDRMSSCLDHSPKARE